jgi:hypothetical protein
MDLTLLHRGTPFRFVHTHIPGDPALPSRFQLTNYLAVKETSHTILLGDMNFTEAEMADALLRNNVDLTLCKTKYPTNVGYDLYTKQIDCIFTHKDLEAVPLTAEEVLSSLERHVHLLQTPTS